MNCCAGPRSERTALIPAESHIAFFGASVLLALAPGPDNIFVLTQSALQGRLSGILVTLGLCTGLLFHTSAVALGFAVVMQNSAVAFTALRICGACYLLFLAWKSFRAEAMQLVTRESGPKSFAALYVRGIIMNITNPKVSIFFLAFLPQFVVQSRTPYAVQILILGFTFIIATILVFSAVAIAAGYLGERLSSSPRIQLVIHRIAGGIFLILALKLALLHR